MRSYRLNRGRNDDRFQTLAIKKCIRIDNCNPLGNDYILEPCTLERAISDCLQLARECQCGNTCTSIECVDANALQIYRQSHRFYSGTTVKCICFDRLHLIRNGQQSNSRATIECVCSNFCNTVRNYNFGQFGTAIQQVITQFCHIRKLDACHPRAIVPRVRTDRCNRCRYFHALQDATAIKRITTNRTSAIIQNDVLNESAISKCIVRNVILFGNRYLAN